MIPPLSKPQEMSKGVGIFRGNEKQEEEVRVTSIILERRKRRYWVFQRRAAAAGGDTVRGLSLEGAQGGIEVWCRGNPSL